MCISQSPAFFAYSIPTQLFAFWHSFRHCSSDLVVAFVLVPPPLLDVRQYPLPTLIILAGDAESVDVVGDVVGDAVGVAAVCACLIWHALRLQLLLELKFVIRVLKSVHLMFCGFFFQTVSFVAKPVHAESASHFFSHS